MNETYQNIIDQMVFDQNTLGLELRYSCSDPDVGYRIVFTEIDDMDSFDTPFMEIARPSVFNLNDLPSDRNLKQLFTFFVNSAYEVEKDCLETMKPIELYQDIYNLISTGRGIIESSELNLGDLFGIAQGIITLTVSTNILEDEENGIGLVVHQAPSFH